MNYQGCAWYFITLCCERRHSVFANRQWAQRFVGCLENTAKKCHFSVHAYCVMPDHFHALVEGAAPACDLLLFVRILKQTSSREYSCESGASLWQKKFYDHILRPKDSPDAVSWYIWMNPVRKGLCSQLNEYPYSGSLTGQWQLKAQPQNQWIPTWKQESLGLDTNPAARAKSAAP
jgi:putative transposase